MCFSFDSQYGPQYEKIRVRNNYSRLPANERNKMKLSLKNEELDTVREIMRFPATQVNDCVRYLEEHQQGLGKNYPARSLVGAIALVLRLQRMQDEFQNATEVFSDDLICDNGYTQLGEWGTVSRGRALVEVFANCFETDEGLHRALYGNETHENVMIFLGYPDGLGLSAEELRNQMNALRNRKDEASRASDE